MEQSSAPLTARYFASDAAVEAIGRGLLERSLPAAAWTHAAHLAAAAWLLSRCPELDAQQAMPGIIRAYNEATGVPNSDTRGYHDTITLASLRAVRAFLAQQPASMALHAACNALLDSPFGDPRWLLRYWSAQLLFSVAARRAWVEPDLAGLPFD